MAGYSSATNSNHHGFWWRWHWCMYIHITVGGLHHTYADTIKAKYTVSTSVVWTFEIFDWTACSSWSQTRLHDVRHSGEVVLDDSNTGYPPCMHAVDKGIFPAPPSNDLDDRFGKQRYSLGYIVSHSRTNSLGWLVGIQSGYSSLGGEQKSEQRNSLG